MHREAGEGSPPDDQLLAAIVAVVAGLVQRYAQPEQGGDGDVVVVHGQYVHALGQDLAAGMEEIRGRLEKTDDFSQKGLESVFSAFLEEKQVKLGKIAQPIRVALTGKTASPGLFEVMEVLGKETVLRRLTDAISRIKKKASANSGTDL